MDQIVAERVYEFWKAGTEQPSTVRVLVGQPQREATGPDWAAPYEIHGPGPDEVRCYYVMGIDAMQALILALQNLPLWLEELPSLGRLRWIGGEGDDTGFEGLVVLGAPAKDHTPPQP